MANYRLRSSLFMVLGIVVLSGIILVTLTSDFRNPQRITVTVDKPSVLERIRSLERLETTSYTMEKVISAQDTTQNALSRFFFGDRILLIAHAEVIAGIDLSKLKQDDISINENKIQINVPAPELFFTRLDNKKTTVYDRSQGILKKNDTELEAAARLEAEQSITRDACEKGILTDAREQSQRTLTALLRALGFSAIELRQPIGTCDLILK